MAKKADMLRGKAGRKTSTRAEEQRFRKYVPETLAQCMNPRQIELLKEEIRQAYRYKLPWHRRAYMRGLWHGIDLVERYFAFSGDELKEQDAAGDPPQKDPEMKKQPL